MSMRLTLVAVVLALAACSPDPQTEPHAGSRNDTPDRSAMNVAQRAYAAANDRMHSAMGSNIPADADVAFVTGMIPHHEGAIAMARIVLEHGTDQENQRLAEAIITSQQAEVAQMRAWLSARGAPQPPVVDVPPAGTGADDAEVDHSKMGH
jgi:uncharacterized protein (DUF305 family)